MRGRRGPGPDGADRPARAAHALTALAALAVGVALVAPGPLWRWVRLAVTAVHEVGHALAAVAAGRRVEAVHLRADTSGMTYHRGSRSWWGRLVTSLAGYPAPAALGVGGAWLLGAGHPRAWMAALLGLGIAALVLWVRNVFGWLLLGAWAAGFGWLAIYGGHGLDRAAGQVAAWVLLLGGSRAAIEQFGRGGAGDAADAARLLHVPAVLCRALFVLVCVAGLVAGGELLLRRA